VGPFGGLQQRRLGWFVRFRATATRLLGLPLGISGAWDSATTWDDAFGVFKPLASRFLNNLLHDCWILSLQTTSEFHTRRDPVQQIQFRRRTAILATHA
jgi:hypothetical protein